MDRNRSEGGGGVEKKSENKKWKGHMMYRARARQIENMLNERFGEEEGGKKRGPLFCGVSPGCGCIKSICGANSCQGLNPISLRGEQKVDKN